MKKLFDGNFDGVLKDADEKYQKKKSEYGESWKLMGEDELHKRFVEELDEFDTSRYDYEELLDVINVTLMLAVRIYSNEDIPIMHDEKGRTLYIKKKDLRREKNEK